MKKMIMLCVLFISMAAHAEAYIGFAQGIHLNGEKINDSHPYFGYNYKSLGVIVYLNSFNKIGIAPYYEFSTDSRVMNFSLKLGATTGYHEYMEYNGRRYRLDSKYFFTDDIMFILIPEVSMSYKKVNIGLSLLGDSLNMGVSWTF